MVVYFRSEKERMHRQRITEASKGVGKPKVGGMFELVDQDGKVWKSEEEMKGKFGLVSDEIARRNEDGAADRQILRKFQGAITILKSSERGRFMTMLTNTGLT